MQYNSHDNFDSENKDDLDNNLTDRIKKVNDIISNDLLITNLEFLINVAEELIDLELYKKAHKITSVLTKSFPYDPEVWFNHGLVYKGLKDTIRALKCFNKALLLNPNDSMLLLERGSCLMLMKNYRAAGKNFFSALKIEPNNPDILYNIGQLYFRLNNYKKSIEYLEESIKIDSEFSDAYFHLALSFEYDKSFEKALKYYDLYLELEPECAVGWFNKGITYEHLKEFEKAIHCYEISVALDDSFVDAHFNLGNILADLGRHTLAVGAFQKALELDSFDEITYFNLSTVYEEMTQYDDAIESYSEAIVLDPFCHEAYLGRAFCYLTKSEDFLLTALIDFSSALATNPVESFRWNKVADDKREVDERVTSTLYATLNKLEINPDNSRYWLLASELYVKLNNFAKAFEAITKAISILPDFGYNHYILAKILFIQNNPQDGVISLKKAFTLDKDIIGVFAAQFPLVYESAFFKKLFNL